MQDTTQADTGRQAGGHRQASSQTSRQTYWQAGGRLAGRDRHASQHVSGQHTSNPRASGHASQHASGRASQHANQFPTCKRTTAKTNARARTHTDITIRSWQYRPAGKAQHRSDRTNTESSGSRPAGTKKARHDAVHITNTESSGSRHKTFVANMQGATRSNTHSRICGHYTDYRHDTY